MSSDKQDFRPVKVKIKSSKQKNTKYLSGELLYSGVNLFGKLSEIYLEKIKNGEMFTGFTSDFSQREAPKNQNISTPSLVKKSGIFKIIPYILIFYYINTKIHHSINNQGIFKYLLISFENKI